jgi:hypothetical protein
MPAPRDLFAHYRLHVELVADKEAVHRMRGVQSLTAAPDKLLDVRATGPLARAIIRDQEREVALLSRWRREWFPG